MLFWMIEFFPINGFQMPFNVEVISTSPKSNIGTRAHWDEVTQSLFYVDIYGTEASILRYDFKENKVFSATVDQEPVVSFIIPIVKATNKFAIGIGRRVGVICWDGKSPKVSVESIAFEVDQGKNDTRFNDAKADPSGRFYGGTMRLEALGSLFEIASGTFYRYSPAEGATELLHNIYISNGLMWNRRENKFYYIDSCKMDVKQFDYNPANGNICKHRSNFQEFSLLLSEFCTKFSCYFFYF